MNIVHNNMYDLDLDLNSNRVSLVNTNQGTFKTCTYYPEFVLPEVNFMHLYRLGNQTLFALTGIFPYPCSY